MLNKNNTSNLEKIKVQLELLKSRLDNVSQTLDMQEEFLDLLQEKSNLLLKEALIPSRYIDSTEAIMKKAFTKGKIPKILYNQL
ncbi:MAG: hypothetical protein A3B68_05740 [Candidatus Melainabacteria bacterium RIFCSPHIGHO2_02_FULL_34_12]|nr:MAG: hypothetical protein A3B68_05740 [Candidatus Melainabacteria bacterium RIFCSPHIGHO2_02_FULL_34_12]